MKFRKTIGTMLVALCVASMPRAAAADSIAQQPKILSAAEMADIKGRVVLATGLIALGRKDKDPQLLAIGAKLLSGLGAGVIDAASMASGGKAMAYDVAGILAEARALSGGEAAAKSVMAKIDLTKPKPQSMCNWLWECNSMECDRYYVCTSE